MNTRLFDSTITRRILVAGERSPLTSTIIRSVVSLNDYPKIKTSPYLQPLDREKNTFTFNPPMLLERQNYRYLKAFTVAQQLQRRKAQLKLFDESVKQPPSSGSRFFVSKTVLCSVPLGCFNFTVDNQFPDETSLRNWLEVMERAVESESLHYGQVSCALIGLAKIQIASCGKLAQEIGWPLLVRWFSYVYKNLAKEARTEKFLVVYDIVSRSAYRMVINADRSSAKLEDFAEISRLACDQLLRYCGYRLAHMTNTSKDDYLLRRQARSYLHLVNALWQTEFAFKSTSNLLGDDVCAQISKFLVEGLPKTNEMSKYWLKDNTELSTDSDLRDAESNGATESNENESTLSSFTKCLFSLRSAYILERWNGGEAEFWLDFFQNPSKTYENYVEIISERVACYYVILAVRVLLRGKNVGEAAPDGAYESFLRDVLKPFVGSHFPTTLHMSHRYEIERLNDEINSYETGVANAGRFLTVDDLKWLKKCLDSYNPPVIVMFR